jgi:F plasmid transfer operon, TraF, protein
MDLRASPGTATLARHYPFVDLDYSKLVFMLEKYSVAFAATLLLASWTPPVAAQSLETTGNRASAMTAFVAVADDASAVVWNPSGLAQGPFLNLEVDLGRANSATSEEPQLTGSAGQHETTLLALGLPPIGVSYYRMGTTFLNPASPAGQLSPNRQDQQVSVRSLVTSHLGVTVLQSLGDRVTIGATAKLVRGSVAVGTSAIRTWSDGFEYAESLETRGSTKGDIDAGALFAAGQFRAGVVARNLTEPTFETGAESASLERHVRLGVAWGDRWPGLPLTIVALDADATRTPHASGDRRDVAAGLERWLKGRRAGVRGGVRASTVGDARPVVSIGGSFALRAGTYVDAYVAKGAREDRAWGIGARVTY